MINGEALLQPCPRTGGSRRLAFTSVVLRSVTLWLVASTAEATEPVVDAVPAELREPASFHVRLGLGGQAHLATRHPRGPAGELLFEVEGSKGSFLFGLIGGYAGDGQRLGTRIGFGFALGRYLRIGPSGAAAWTRTLDDWGGIESWVRNDYLRGGLRLDLHLGPAYLAVDPGVRLMRLIDGDSADLGLQPGVYAVLGVRLPG